MPGAAQSSLTSDRSGPFSVICCGSVYVIWSASLGRSGDGSDIGGHDYPCQACSDRKGDYQHDSTADPSKLEHQRLPQ